MQVFFFSSFFIFADSCIEQNQTEVFSSPAKSHHGKKEGGRGGGGGSAFSGVAEMGRDERNELLDPGRKKGREGHVRLIAIDFEH